MQETDQESEVSQLFRVFDIEGAGVIGWLEIIIWNFSSSSGVLLVCLEII